MSFKSVLFLAWKFPKQTLKSLLHSHSHRPFRPICVFIVLFPSLRRGHPASCVPPLSSCRAYSHDALAWHQWFSLRLHTFKKKENKKLSRPVFQVGESRHTQYAVVVFIFSWTCFTDAPGCQNHVTRDHVSNSPVAQMLRCCALKCELPILATILLFLRLASQTEVVPLPCVDPLTPPLNLCDCQVFPPKTWSRLFTVAFQRGWAVGFSGF